jgi:hypothetical protein
MFICYIMGDDRIINDINIRNKLKDEFPYMEFKIIYAKNHLPLHVRKQLYDKSMFFIFKDGKFLSRFYKFNINLSLGYIKNVINGNKYRFYILSGYDKCKSYNSIFYNYKETLALNFPGIKTIIYNTKDIPKFIKDSLKEESSDDVKMVYSRKHAYDLVKSFGYQNDLEIIMEPFTSLLQDSDQCKIDLLKAMGFTCQIPCKEDSCDNPDCKLLKICERIRKINDNSYFLIFNGKRLLSKDIHVADIPLKRDAIFDILSQ